MSSEISDSKPAPSAASIISWIANAVLALVAIAFAFMYFQTSQNLEAQKSAVAALQMDIAKEASHSAELKSDLNAARTDAQTLAAMSAQLKSEVERKEQDLAAEKSKSESVQSLLDQEKAKLPPVPVRIQMRTSAMGRGLVAMFTNTSARQLSLLMATRNPTTHAIKQLSFQAAPGAKVEIGFVEGVQFASGDQVRLRSAGYEDVPYTVP
jgi:septal ring factor EnvC (AmiA/AmiB activator)